MLSCNINAARKSINLAATQSREEKDSRFLPVLVAETREPSSKDILIANIFWQLAASLDESSLLVVK